jgi:hypothetical protein
MWASLEPERLDGFHSYTAFSSLFITGGCPVTMNIPTAKMTFMDPKTQNDSSAENGSNKFRLNVTILWRPEPG